MNRIFTFVETLGSKLFLVLVMSLCYVANVSAEETYSVSVDPIRVDIGGSTTIDLNINTTEDIAGFQMDIYVPNTITLSNPVISADRVNVPSFTISLSELSTSSTTQKKYRLWASSTTVDQIPAGSSPFCSLTLSASSSFVKDSYMSINEIIFVADDETQTAGVRRIVVPNPSSIEIEPVAGSVSFEKGEVSVKKDGTTVQPVGIAMTGIVDLYNVKATFQVPVGLKISGFTLNSDRLDSSFAPYYNEISNEDGTTTYIVAVASSSAQMIQGASGVLFYANLVGSESMVDDTTQVYISDVVGANFTQEYPLMKHNEDISISVINYAKVEESNQKIYETISAAINEMTTYGFGLMTDLQTNYPVGYAAVEDHISALSVSITSLVTEITEKYNAVALVASDSVTVKAQVADYRAQFDQLYQDAISAQAEYDAAQENEKAYNELIADIEDLELYLEEVRAVASDYSVSAKYLRAFRSISSDLSDVKDTVEEAYAAGTAASLDITSELESIENAINEILDEITATTGINSASISTDNGAKIFTVNGKSVSAPVKGINIVKYSDGTVKKVIVK